jgi:hypothetical protein
MNLSVRHHTVSTRQIFCLTYKYNELEKDP